MKKFISSLISVSLIAATLVMPMTANAAEDYADHAKIAEAEINPNRIVQPATYHHFTDRNSNYSGSSPWQTGRWVVYELNADASTNAKYWCAEGIIISSSADYDASKYNWKEFQPNTDYVYSYTLKNMSAEGITPKFCIAQWSKNADGVRTVDFETTDITSREGQRVTVTLSTDVTASAGAMGFPDGVTRNGKENPLSPDGSVVYINMDDAYIGIEQFAEVSNEAIGAPMVTAGGSLEAKASNLNQCGAEGKLDQSFTYIALNSNRTEMVEDISIVPGENGAYTINVADTVKEGEYVILARSGLSTEDKLMQKGLTISVINPEEMDWEDHAKIADEDINPNRFVEPINANHFTSRNSTLANIVANQGRWAQYTVDNASAGDYWCNEGTFFNTWTTTDEATAACFNWTTWEGNTNYVHSVEVKNMSAEGITPRFGYALFSTNAAGSRVLDYKTFDVTSREGQKLTVTLTTDATGSAGSMGFPNGTSNYGAKNPKTADGSVVYLNMDTMYIGVEQYAEITNEAPAEIEVGDTVKGKVEVLNQAGDKGKLAQGYDLLVLNGDRTDVAKGVIATPGANGEYTIAVDEDAKSGEYVILATATDSDVTLQKGATIKVINLAEMNLADNAKLPEEKINPNRFKAPVNSSHFTSANSNLAKKTVDGRWAVYTVDNSVADDWWCNAGTYLNNWAGDNAETVAKNFNWTTWEGNTNYVYSFEAKNMSADGITPRFGFAQWSTNAAGSRVLDYKTFDVTSRDSQMLTVTLTTDVNGSAASMGFPNGASNYGAGSNPKTADGSVVYINMDKAYIGVEQAAEITNVATSSTLVLAGDTVSAKAEILNQAGDKGKLDQNIKFMVLDGERSEIIKDITVTPGENGAYTINTDDASAGDYVVLAIDEDTGLQVGLEITVVDSLADTEAAAAPANMFVYPTDANHYRNRYGALADITSDGGTEVYTWQADKTIYNTLATNGSILPSTAGTLSFNWKQIEADSYYLVKFNMKNLSAEGITPKFGVHLNAGDGTTTCKDWEIVDVTARDEWQEFSAILYSSVDGTSSNMFVLGYPTGGTINGVAVPAAVEGSVVGIERASMSITKLDAVDVKVSQVANADALTFKAEVINQLGTTEGVKNQKFEWFAMNTERTERIDGITLTPSADTTTVTAEVDEDLADGTYAIVAVATDYGMVKGFIYEKTPAAPAEFAVTGAEWSDINELTVACEGIPETGKTIMVYFAKYLEDVFVGAEIKPITFDGKLENESKPETFTIGDGYDIVKAFVWDSDMNALVDTPVLWE